MPPGGFDRQPEDLRTIQLDNARTMPLLWSAPPWAVSCDMLTAFDKTTMPVHGADSNAYWRTVVPAKAGCLTLAEVAVLPGVHRTDERRVGQECDRTCTSRWSPEHYRKH